MEPKHELNTLNIPEIKKVIWNNYLKVEAHNKQNSKSNKENNKLSNIRVNFNFISLPRVLSKITKNEMHNTTQLNKIREP